MNKLANVHAAHWRTSSYTAGNGQCVEMAVFSHTGEVAVRDTKDRSRPAALIPTPAWTTFLDHLKN